MMTSNSTDESALSGMANLTDNIVLASVELYTVVLVFLLLLTAAVFGALTNLALLISIKCKRSIRNLHYGLPFSLSATNLLVCVVWMIVHTIQMVQNYDRGTAWPSICYLNVISFHLSVGAIVFTTVFIATQRIYRLLQSSSPHMSCLVISGLCASWTGGIIAALAMVLQFDSSVDYEICIHGSLTNQSQHLSHSTVATVIFFIYILVLFTTLVAMTVLVMLQRRHLVTLVLKGSRESRMSIQENNRHGDGEKKRVSVIGDVGVPTTSSREPSDSGRKVSQTFIPVQETFRPGRVPMQQVQHDATEDEDEDTFDMKMRDRWQKTGSGRRHTVANIGVRDTLFGPRRGSLGDTKPAQSNYHYVRKWSVDIVALQDQLENPKLNTSSNPFPGLSILKEKDKEQERPAAELLEETDDAAEDKITDITPTTETESKQEEEIEDINDSTEPLQSTEAPVLCNYGNQHDAKAGCRGDGVDDDKVKRLEKELARCTKYMLLLTVTLLCVLPYAVLQMLQGSMSAHANRNITYIMAAVCIVQCPLHPVILAWLDSRLSSALSRLRIKLTHWRCVCYCNIGNGKRCLGRHRKHNIAEEVPDS